MLCGVNSLYFGFWILIKARGLPYNIQFLSVHYIVSLVIHDFSCVTKSNSGLNSKIDFFT